MGKTSRYVFAFLSYLCQLKEQNLTSSYQIFSLESQTSALQHISESTYPDSNFDLFEGDIAGINGFDVLAGQEVKQASFILRHC